jgi:hypothetical protein
MRDDTLKYWEGSQINHKKIELQPYTLFDPTNCTKRNKSSLVPYVPRTCFDLYKLITKEVNAKAYKYRGAAIAQSV